MTSPNRKNIKNADKALLWARSGGVCCFPDCSVVCVEEANEGDPAAVIGQIAHIEAYSNKGPRANRSLSNEERNSYANLILLCPTHHRQVDAQENTYSDETLKGWKSERESIYQNFLTQEMGNITFAELETVTQALVGGVVPSPNSMTVIPPQEKMERNGLTNQTAILLNIGFLQSRQVQQFVETMGGLDTTFTTRLTSGFINEYQRQRQARLEGDALFEAMRLFSSQGRTDIRYQCAGLAVLVYLFERCEVFEP